MFVMQIFNRNQSIVPYGTFKLVGVNIFLFEPIIIFFKIIKNELKSINNIKNNIICNANV